MRFAAALLLIALIAAALTPASAWWEWRPPFWVENGPPATCGWFPRPPCPMCEGPPLPGGGPGCNWYGK